MPRTAVGMTVLQMVECQSLSSIVADSASRLTELRRLSARQMH